MRHRTFFHYLLVIAVVVCIHATGWANSRALMFEQDVILQWNRVLRETVATPGQQPATIMPVRSYAIMRRCLTR